MTEQPNRKLVNVVAVNIKTGAKRIISERKTVRNAEAIVKIAVAGVDEEFFKMEDVLEPPLTEEEVEQEFANRMHADFERQNG